MKDGADVRNVRVNGLEYEAMNCQIAEICDRLLQLEKRFADSEKKKKDLASLVQRTYQFCEEPDDWRNEQSDSLPRLENFTASSAYGVKTLPFFPAYGI